MNLRHLYAGFPACLTLVFAAGLHAQNRCVAPRELSAVVDSSTHYGTLGNWYKRHGDLRCAIWAFAKGIALDPQSAVLHAALGEAQYAVGDAAHARAELQRSIAIDPKFDRAYLALGVIEHERGDRDAALHDWEIAARLNPESSVALDWIAKARIEAGQYTAAIDLLRTASSTEDLAADLLVAEDKASMFEEAIASGQRSLALHPDWQRLKMGIAVLLVQRNRLEEAAALLRTAIAQQPDSVEGKLLYLRVLVLKNDTEVALPYATALLRRYPDNFDVLYLSGLLERVQGDFPAALAHLKAALVKQPNHYDANFNLGTTLAKLHRNQEAKDNLARAAAMPDAAPEVHFQLAGVLRAMGDGEGAAKELAVYQEKLHARAEHDQLVSLSAQAWQKLSSGDAAEAAKLERKILKDFPDEAVHWYDLALALDQLGDVEGESTALSEAVRLRPAFATAWNQLGYLDMRSGQPEKAVEAFHSAISSAPQFAEAENNLGSLLAQEGKDAEAEGYFRSALDANPRCSEAWVNLAAILAANRRFADARAAVESALRIEPHNAEATELLNLLPRAAADAKSRP